ncbi:hypothetical protein [Levilactobacillus yonginensis]|jgi:hypothetical protein
MNLVSLLLVGLFASYFLGIATALVGMKKAYKKDLLSFERQ